MKIEIETGSLKESLDPIWSLASPGQHSITTHDTHSDVNLMATWNTNTP